MNLYVCVNLWNLSPNVFNSSMRTLIVLFKFTRLHVLRYMYNKHQVILNSGTTYIKSYSTCIIQIVYVYIFQRRTYKCHFVPLNLYPILTYRFICQRFLWGNRYWFLISQLINSSISRCDIVFHRKIFLFQAMRRRHKSA